MLATQFAASEAERVAPSEKTVRQKLSLAAGLRRKVLSALEALAANDFIPHKEVEPILEGRGPMDMAKDCVAGVALLRKYENDIAGRNPATAETMSEAEQVGSWLMANLRVGEAPPEKAGPPPVEVDIRNRMATPWPCVTRNWNSWRIGSRERIGKWSYRHSARELERLKKKRRRVEDILEGENATSRAQVRRNLVPREGTAGVGYATAAGSVGDGQAGIPLVDRMVLYRSVHVPVVSTDL